MIKLRSQYQKRKILYLELILRGHGVFPLPVNFYVSNFYSMTVQHVRCVRPCTNTTEYSYMYIYKQYTTYGYTNTYVWPRSFAHDTRVPSREMLIMHGRIVSNERDDCCYWLGIIAKKTDILMIIFHIKITCIATRSFQSWWSFQVNGACSFVHARKKNEYQQKCRVTRNNTPAEQWR